MNTGHKVFDGVSLMISWVFGLISLNATSIPIILSCIASLTIIINNIKQIRKKNKS